MSIGIINSSNRYIACEDVGINWEWDDRQVALFDRMWQQGMSIWDIAKAFDRDPDEVAILAIDRARQGFIERRPGGAYGRRKQR